MPQRTVSLDNSPNERAFTVVAVIDNIHQKEIREREIREALQYYIWKIGVCIGILGILGGIVYILINYPP